MQYGSVEKGLLVTISDGDDDNRTCTAFFQAGRESDAHSGAAELSSTFCHEQRKVENRNPMA